MDSIITDPLVHPPIKSCTNVLLIDKSIMEPRLFYDSVNDDTFPILYSSSSLKSELLDLLGQLSFQRLGIVFIHNRFLDNQSFFENTDFFKSLGVNHIDFLACDTLNDPNWVNFYDSLSPITVGASNDKTGNIKYGGDWVMESTSEDIEAVYFTESIEYYSYLLDSVGYFVVGIKNNNTIWGTGSNNYGQIYNDPYQSQNNTLTQFSSIYMSGTPKYVYTGNYYTIVLTEDGKIFGTGPISIVNSTIYIIPSLPNANIGRVLYPLNMSMIGSRQIQFISAGGTYFILLMSDGTIWVFGDNYYGQLGINNNATVLTQMDTFMIYRTTPKSISCGAAHTIVLMTDNTIWGCGYNFYGQLGIATNDNVNKYVLTKMNTSNIGGTTPKSISCGDNHTIVLMTDNTIWGCGYNFYGQLGIAVNDNMDKYVLTKMNTSNIGGTTPKSISCGSAHTIVLMADNTIWGCGYNLFGQLGIATNDNVNKYVLTKMNTSNIGGTTPNSISCGGLNTYALMQDGSIWGCGSNQFGQLGIGIPQNPFFSTLLVKMTTNNNNFSKIMNNSMPITTNYINNIMNYSCQIDISGTNVFQDYFINEIQPSLMSITDIAYSLKTLLTTNKLQFFSTNPSSTLYSYYGINGLSTPQITTSSPIVYGYSTLSSITNSQQVGHRTGNISSFTGSRLLTTANQVYEYSSFTLSVGVWYAEIYLRHQTMVAGTFVKFYLGDTSLATNYRCWTGSTSSTVNTTMNINTILVNSSSSSQSKFLNVTSGVNSFNVDTGAVYLTRIA
jgi:alpha-tubulin suppressor-like RCC1 family protein